MADTAVVNMAIVDAYTQLKTLLAQTECTILSEASPRSITVKHGSLWGTSPKTAKKTIHYRLSPRGFGTEIKSVSALSLGYVQLAGAGCVFALGLMLLCAWISLDLGSFAASQQQSSWSWLVASDTYVHVQGALLLSDLARVLAVFLGVALVLEGVILFYVRRGLGEFAGKILEMLAQKTKN